MRDTKQKQKREPDKRSFPFQYWKFLLSGCHLSKVKRKEKTNRQRNNSSLYNKKASCQRMVDRRIQKVDRIHKQIRTKYTRYWIILASHPERNNRNTCWRISLGATLSQIYYYNGRRSSAWHQQPLKGIGTRQWGRWG